MAGRTVDGHGGHRGAHGSAQDQSGEQQISNQAQATPAGQTDTANGATGGAASLEEQLAAARAEAEQYKDKYLREVAEKDNFRKRQERMAFDRSRREKLDLLDRVLDVTDNLDRALRYQDTMDRASLEQGLRLLGGQLNEVLRAEGLTPIPTVGQAFNPYVHEAIESVPSAQYPEGTVVEEVRKGYKLGDETVRPARVKVSSGPTKK